MIVIIFMIYDMNHGRPLVRHVVDPGLSKPYPGQAAVGTELIELNV